MWHVVDMDVGQTPSRLNATMTKVLASGFYFEIGKNPPIQFKMEVIVTRENVYLVNHMMETIKFKIDIFYLFIVD